MPRRITHTDGRPIIIYDSTREMVETARAYVSAPLPPDAGDTARRWHATAEVYARQDRPRFLGKCASLDEAAAACNERAPAEIAKKARELEDKWRRETQTAPRVKWTREEQGTDIITEAALAPYALAPDRLFRRRRRIPAPSPRVTIVFPAGLSASYSAKDYADRAYILAAAASVLTAKGYSVAIFAEFTERSFGRRTHTVFYPLKRHSEPLSTASLYFGTRPDTARRARFIQICKEQADMPFDPGLGKPEAIGKKAACRALGIPEAGTTYFPAAATPQDMLSELHLATRTA